MIKQGSKLTVASSKYATWKAHLPPVVNVGSKKLLPKISAVKLKPISLKITSACMTQHNAIMPLTIWNYV